MPTLSRLACVLDTALFSGPHMHPFLTILVDVLVLLRTSLLQITPVDTRSVRHQPPPSPREGKTLLFAHQLRQGFACVFSLGCHGPRRPRNSSCLASAPERPMVVREKLAKEISWVELLVHFPLAPLLTCNVPLLVLYLKQTPTHFGSSIICRSLRVTLFMIILLNILCCTFLFWNIKFNKLPIPIL